jgi:hypothetical protein
VRVFEARPGQRVAIDTACSTAQSYLVRILQIELGAGANFVVPRLVFTPTLSPDAAWSTSGSAAAYRFDPGSAFSLSVGGSLYLESAPMTEVAGSTLPANVTSRITYDVTTYGTGLNDSVHAASPSLTCTYPLFRAQAPAWAFIPVGAYEVELLSDSAFPSVPLRFSAGGINVDVVVGRAAGARASVGYANAVSIPALVASDAFLQFRVRLPGSVA